MGVSPAPALLNTLAAPGANATAVTVLNAGYGSTSTVTVNSVDYIPYVAFTDPSPSSPNLYSCDCLLVEGDDTIPPTPFPGEGLPPLDPPPSPVGPVVPA
jgi:hypothetical protein